MTTEAIAAASSGVEHKPNVCLWWILTANYLSSQVSFLWKNEGYDRKTHLPCVLFLIFFPSITGQYWREDYMTEKSLLGLFQHSNSFDYWICQLSQRGFIAFSLENII